MVTRPRSWHVSAATPADEATWRSLYRAYADSAGQLLEDEHLARVWGWAMSEDGQTRCLLLRAYADAEPVGLAHHRLFERPLAGSLGCYLDDLFVDPAHRGRGGARALLEHLADLARSESWTTVRWTTGLANPAQALYDSIATRNPVITFDMAPRHG